MLQMVVLPQARIHRGRIRAVWEAKKGLELKNTFLRFSTSKKESLPGLSFGSVDVFRYILRIQGKIYALWPHMTDTHKGG